MLRQLKILVILCVFISPFADAATPEATGLYLSFEQRLAVTYALMAQGETPQKKEEILAQAKSHFLKISKNKVQTVEVANFKEFLRHFRGDWPNTQSVALDLEILQKRPTPSLTSYVAKSPRVQKQIDNYREWQLDQLAPIFKNEMSQLTVGPELLALENGSLQRDVEKWILEYSENKIASKLNELNRVGEKMAQSGFAQQKDATMRIFMQTMFSEYFSRLSGDSKKLIVSSFLGGDLRATDLQKFEVMVQNSGPQLQKLLQIVARQADLEPEMLEVFRALENSVRPVPWDQIEEILKVEKGNYKFIYFEKKPLGVGTMAQVHRAKIEQNGVRHEVVVRFIKPGIAGRIQEDRRILKEVAKILDENPAFRKTGVPKLSPVVEDISDTVTAELSQEDTVERQKIAKSRYEKTVLMNTPEYKTYLEFHVPAIFESRQKSQFLVQEMVVGKKLDKEVATYAESIPGMKRFVSEEIAKLWAQEVIFGGGFYHSDLHQGNFMLNVTDPKIQVNILDYGMGGVLSEALQRRVMLLGAGVDLKDANMIARAFWQIKVDSSISEAQFYENAAARISRVKMNVETNTSMEHWTAWAMDQGIKLPYEFISLNRGMTIMNKLLADSGSSLNLTILMKVLARSHPAVVYKRLVLDEKVAMTDLARLGWMELVRVMDVKTPPVSLTKIRCEAMFH